MWVTGEMPDSGDLKQDTLFQSLVTVCVNGDGRGQEDAGYWWLEAGAETCPVQVSTDHMTTFIAFCNRRHNHPCHLPQQQTWSELYVYTDVTCMDACMYRVNFFTGTLLNVLCTKYLYKLWQLEPFCINLQGILYLDNLREYQLKSRP